MRSGKRRKFARSLHMTNILTDIHNYYFALIMLSFHLLFYLSFFLLFYCSTFLLFSLFFCSIFYISTFLFFYLSNFPLFHFSAFLLLYCLLFTVYCLLSTVYCILPGLGKGFPKRYHTAGSEALNRPRPHLDPRPHTPL